MITHADFIRKMMLWILGGLKMGTIRFDERTLTVLDKDGKERFSVEVRELDCR